jgi:HEAT repeat protein
VKPEARWAELVELAEHELVLVRDSRWEELPAASAQRMSAAETLGTPPAEARPHLERLLEVQREIHAGVATARAFTQQKLGNMERGHTALVGYSGGYRRPAATSIDGRA